MDDKKIAELQAWAAKPENFEKFPLKDKAAMLTALAEYQGKIIPIILKNLAKDETARFFIKL